MSTGGIFILQTNGEKMSNPIKKNQEISANEIIPGLWLGNEESSQNENFIKKAKISVIVNVTKHIPCKWSRSNIGYYQIPVNDPGPGAELDQEDNQVMIRELPFVLEYINLNL